MIGRAFIHDRRGPVLQRTIDDVAVTGYPADVGGAPVDVFVLEIEHPLRRYVSADRVASRRVQDALGLSCASRSVQDEQRVFSFERFCCAPV